MFNHTYMHKCFRGWRRNTIPIILNIIFFTRSSKRKSKVKQQSVLRAIPMDFYGSLGIIQLSISFRDLSHLIFNYFFRAMDYLIELFGNLVEHPDWSMSHVCTHSYAKTLKQWHGFLASSSFTVCEFIIPSYLTECSMNE